MAPELKAYAEKLSAESVGKAVLFTTSNWSKRTVKGLRKILRDKGIPVEEEFFYVQMLSAKKKTGEAEVFGARMKG